MISAVVLKVPLPARFFWFQKTITTAVPMKFQLSCGKCCECKSRADRRWEKFYQDEKKLRRRKLDIKYRLIKLPEQREGAPCAHKLVAFCGPPLY